MTIYKKIIYISSEELKTLLRINPDVFITGIELSPSDDTIRITCQSSNANDGGMFEVVPCCHIPLQKWNMRITERTTETITILKEKEAIKG